MQMNIIQEFLFSWSYANKPINLVNFDHFNTVGKQCSLLSQSYYILFSSKGQIFMFNSVLLANVLIHKYAYVQMSHVDRRLKNLALLVMGWVTQLNSFEYSVVMWINMSH